MSMMFRHVLCRYKLVVVLLCLPCMMYVIMQHNSYSMVPVPTLPPYRNVSAEVQDHIKVLNGSEWLSHPKLRRALSPATHALYMQLLEDFMQLLKSVDVQVVMVDGTLLGSYLFHDILPWDEDLDVMVHYADRYKIFRLFSDRELRKTYGVMGFWAKEDWYTLDRLENPWTIDNSSDIQFKFYRMDSPKAGSYDWRWPFIDVKYYKVVGQQVVKFQLYKPDEPVSLKVFFPLQRRPLGRLWLLAPADSRFWLRDKYHTFACKSHSWNHRLEEKTSEQLVPCSELLEYYPCVNRQWTDGWEHAWETLVLRGRPIHTVRVHEPPDVVKGCYDVIEKY